MVAGKVYRNKKMQDVDLFVVEANGLKITGWWILRSSGKILGGSTDMFEMKDPGDWSEVNEEEKEKSSQE